MQSQIRDARAVATNVGSIAHFHPTSTGSGLLYCAARICLQLMVRCPSFSHISSRNSNPTHPNRRSRMKLLVHMRRGHKKLPSCQKEDAGETRGRRAGSSYKKETCARLNRHEIWMSPDGQSAALKSTVYQGLGGLPNESLHCPTKRPFQGLFCYYDITLRG